MGAEAVLMVRGGWVTEEWAWHTPFSVCKWAGIKWTDYTYLRVISNHTPSRPCGACRLRLIDLL